MRVRCVRCATLYRLDDSLLPPDGAPVQCTRCGHVFLARPEAPPPPPARNPAADAARMPPARPAVPATSPVRTPAAVPAAEPNTPAGMPPARPAAPPPAPVRNPAALPEVEPTAPAGMPPARPAAPPPAPVRNPAALPEVEPTTPAGTPPGVPAAPRHAAPPTAAAPVSGNGVAAGAMQLPSAETKTATPPATDDASLSLELPPGWDDASLPSDGFAETAAGDDPVLAAFHRRLARRRKIVLGAVVGVLGIAVVAGLGTWLVKEFGGPSYDPAAVEKADRLLAAVRTGDPAQALAAAPLGEEALALEPGFLRARADRGLAFLVAAMERKDLADRLAAKKPPIERALRTAEEAADETAAQAKRDELAALKAEYDPVLAAYSKLKADADGAIEGAYQEKGGEEDPAVVRALGVLRAFGGDEKNAPILAKNYRKLAGEEDGWAELIEGLLYASGRASPEKRAKAVESLDAALAKDRSFGIARLLLGRARLDLKDFAGARQQFDQALVVAPKNELAKRWREDVEQAVAAATKPAGTAGEGEPPPAPGAGSAGAAEPPPAPGAGSTAAAKSPAPSPAG
jgi:predicted Zn finger-like uncharacterized protein